MTHYRYFGRRGGGPSDRVERSQTWSDSSTTSEEPHSENPQLKPTLPVNFRRVSELQPERCLFFRDESIDRFVGGLHPGSMFFLYGSWQCLAASLFLSIRAQLDPEQGGLDSATVFIDAGNTFDPYLAAEYAEKFDLDRDRALDRILVSRAFTCHQLTSLIRALWNPLHEHGAKLAVISDMIELYRDPDLRDLRALDLFRIALNSLTTTARLERAIVLATSLDEKMLGSDPFLNVIKQRVDIVLRFEERRNATKLTFEKHPTHSGGSAVMKQPTPKVLEEFLEATAHG